MSKTMKLTNEEGGRLQYLLERRNNKLLETVNSNNIHEILLHANNVRMIKLRNTKFVGHAANMEKPEMHTIIWL
jgi:hypothetical protein